jgi:WhiB family transcriptional regulator, redox-sensing transcriptional regulator
MTAAAAPLMLPTPGNWALSALCTQQDPDAWFPQSQGKWATAEARRTCRTCPVLQECRKYTLAVEAHLPDYDIHGVWAGLTALERKALYRDAGWEYKDGVRRPSRGRAGQPPMVA